MNSQHQLDNSQLQLLKEIGTSKGASLLKVRSKLSWELGKYATALHVLEELGLIRRDGLKAICTEAGIVALQHQKSGRFIKPSLDSQGHSFADDVKVHQLPVNELWLPNLESFLCAVGIRR